MQTRANPENIVYFRPSQNQRDRDLWYPNSRQKELSKNKGRCAEVQEGRQKL